VNVTKLITVARWHNDSKTRHFGVWKPGGCGPMTPKFDLGRDFLHCN